MSIFKKNLSVLILLISLLVLTYTQFNMNRWRKGDIIKNDIIEYYGYLPALFIEKDLKLDFVEDAQRMEGKIYWYTTHPDGSRMFKYTMGLSYLYAPFFLVAHTYAGIMGFPQTGFSEPYHMFVSLSSLFWLFLGLWFLRKVLLEFFSEKITAVSLLLVVFATNLFYYATNEPAMSHAYNFSLVSILMWLSIRWQQRASLKYAALIGLVGGLLFIIRPVNGLFMLIPVLYNVRSFKDLTSRAGFFLKNYSQILVMGLMAFLVVLPQMLYWKYVGGSFIVYSYSQEGFFFSEPMILRGLFSFRKGWFIYTPIMLFASVGLWWARKYAPQFLSGIVVFMCLNLYVLMSWWCWWYGGSFGQRTLIDSYPLMAIGLASLLAFVFQKKRNFVIRTAAVGLLMLFTILNLVQTQQYRAACIHWESMSREYYFAIFGKLKCPYEKQYLLSHPDYEAALKGQRKQ